MNRGAGMSSDERFAALQSRVPNVSRETFGLLSSYAEAIERWTKSHNLVAPSTLPFIWQRHILDCCALPSLAPDACRWLDLGSGSGLPGLVIACLLRNRTESHVSLVEANGKKAGFLRHVVGSLSLNATVQACRIEDANVGKVDVVTARALAPLPRLLSLAEPWLTNGARGLFQKGRDYRREVEESADSWTLDLIEHPNSATDDGGVILEVSNLRRKF
jgi:16S rRNA (guanine527-N7)-methyltransferase